MTYGIIYRAFLQDDRSYIGQTTQSLERRKKVHKTRSKKENTHFLSAIRKYGYDAFGWEILEECNNKESLDLAERKWIKYFDSIENGFNLKDGGSYGKHSKETKNKIRESKIGNRNPRFGKIGTNKGKKFSEEHKIRLSESHLGQAAWNKGLPKEKQPAYGVICSEEKKNKISKTNSGEGNGMAKITKELVKQMRKDYETGIFLVKEIANKYNISGSHASNILNYKVWK